jgi:hypothetical protein
MSKKQRFLIALVVGVASIGLVFPGASPVAAAAPKGAPAELKVAFIDFFSGVAAVFGISGKYASEFLVNKWNQEGGIRGVPIKLVVLDENGGPKLPSTDAWCWKKRWTPSSGSPPAATAWPSPP